MANISELTRLQMKAILGPDSQEPFLTFISDLRSNSEEKKAEAKSMLEIMKQMDPESLAIKLSNCLAAPNSDVGTRENCAEHLCDLLTDDEDLFIWHNHLSVSTQSAIKCILLDRIKLEQDSDFIIEQLCYTIFRLATSILPDNNWPELLPFLFQCLALSTSTNYLKESVFTIFSSLAFHIGKTLIPCVKPLHPLFLTTLNDHTLHLNVRFQATIAALSFISDVPTSSNGFQELLPQLQKTQMEAILSHDSQKPFLTFIGDLHSSSDLEKSVAKSMFKIIKEKDPESFAIKLAQYLGHNSCHGEWCAQHLRELLTDEEDQDLFTWHNRLNSSTQTAIKSTILDRFKLEQESEFLVRNLAHTVSKLAISILPDNNWPELLPFLFQCLSPSTSNYFQKLMVLGIFGELAIHIGETIAPCMKPLHAKFLNTLKDCTLNINLRIGATGAVFKVILFVPVSLSEKERFQELLPGMLRTLSDALSNCDAAKNVLDHFIYMATKDPKFFRSQLRDVVYSMFEIAKDENLEMKTRHLAVEFVLTLVEARQKAPGMMKKLPLFTHTYFAVLLNLLLDIKDEPSWHSADDIHDETGATDNHNFGRKCLGRFSIAFGEKTIAPVAMEHLGKYLVAREWEKRHAAVVALCKIAKGSSKVMTKYLQKVVDMVLRSSKDPHPRVKWAALCAIDQFSLDFCPYFQEQYHKRVLPALTEAMDDSKNPRVQAHAALVVGNFCDTRKPETLSPHLDKVFNKLLVLLQNDNQMVQEAALMALSSTANLSMGHFQKYYDIVCPYLKTILLNANDESDHNLLRDAVECLCNVVEAVGKEKFRDDFKQAHAALAVGNFCDTRKPDTLLPHLDKILNKLFVLLQNDNQIIHKAALRALMSFTADLSVERFQKYYDIVFPYLKTILLNAKDKSDHHLLNHALECICKVVVAVGKEKFRDDFKPVMEVLKLLLESQMKELDTILSIFKTCIGICISMRKDFLPYMSKVMSSLFECAQLEPDKTVSLYQVYEQDAIICVKGSDLLFAKSGACFFLGEFAYALEEDFFPWIPQAASILVPLLKFYIHDEVRENASSAMYKLLCSAELAVEKGTAQGANMSYFKQLSGDIIMAFGDALYSEPKTEMCSLILEELNKCLKICAPLFDEDQIGSIINVLQHVLNESSHRKGELAERKESEDFDGEEDELMRDEIEQEIEVFQNVGDIITTLIKIFKASFLPFFDKLSFYLMPVKGEDKAAKERKKCILIFDEILLHCGESAIKYCEIYIPFLLDSSIDENPDVREVALIGLGLCAACGGYSFKPFIRDSLSRINEINTHCNALEVENIKAYETAVFALDDICYFHGESIDSALILPALLNCLPIKGFGANEVHDQLCSMIESSNEVFWGHNDLHLPKVISVFTKVLCAGDSLATKETRKRMINILRHFTQALPLSTWASIWPLLLPEEAMELESVLSAWKMFTFQHLTIYCDAQSSTLMILQP